METTKKRVRRDKEDGLIIKEEQVGRTRPDTEEANEGQPKVQCKIKSFEAWQMSTQNDDSEEDDLLALGMIPQQIDSPGNLFTLAHPWFVVSRSWCTNPRTQVKVHTEKTKAACRKQDIENEIEERQNMKRIPRTILPGG